MKKYLLYDDRAVTEGTDDLNVLTVSSTLHEARRDARDFGFPCAIFEYDVRGDELINEQFVELASSDSR